MPTARQKVKMPSGKLIQASFSPSGMTMVLLSERQVIVHPIGEIFGSPNLKPRDRYQLVRSIDDLSVAHGTGKLRSVSASDGFILFPKRWPGKILNVQLHAILSTWLDHLPQILLYQLRFGIPRETHLGHEWQLVDTTDCYTSAKLCNATVSWDGNMVLQFHDYLLLWHRSR